MDTRKAFIVDRIFAYLGVYERGGQFAQSRSELEAALASDSDLHRFVSDPQFKTLQAYSLKNAEVGSLTIVWSRESIQVFVFVRFQDLLEIRLSLEVVAGAPGSVAVVFEQEVWEYFFLSLLVILITLFCLV